LAAGFIGLLTTTASAEVLTSGRPLLGKWSFDETTQTAIDEVGDNDGTISGSAVTIGTFAGKPAANFPTANRSDHIRFEHRGAYELAAGAVALRFYNTGLYNPTETLFSKDAFGFVTGGHLTIRTHNLPGSSTEGFLEVRFQSDSESYYLTSGTLQLDVWYEVEFAFGPNGMELAVDDVVVDSDSYTGGMTGNEEPFALGAARTHATTGTWDDMRHGYSGYVSGLCIYGPREPFVYCESLANTSGQPGTLDYNGSTSIAANDAEIVISGLPANKPAYLFYGFNQAEAPFGEGVRCIGAPIVRYRKVPSTGPTGMVTVPLDFTSPPLSSGPGQAVPGVPLYFQLWFRDPQGGPEGFNTTGALCVVFEP